MISDPGWMNWVHQQRTQRTADIWTQWTTTSSTDFFQEAGEVASGIRQPRVVEPVVRTAAEIAADEARMRAYREEESRKRRLQEEIEHRAEELFLSFLNEEQRESYKKKQQFEVCAKSGTRYRLRRQYGTPHATIRELDKHGREIAHYCSHVPHGELPGADNILAQLLAIRFDEKEGFLLRANRSPLAVN